MRYEIPYIIIGNVVRTKSKKAPKDICTDRIIGTWKVENTD